MISPVSKLLRASTDSRFGLSVWTICLASARSYSSQSLSTTFAMTSTSQITTLPEGSSHRHLNKPSHLLFSPFRRGEVLKDSIQDLLPGWRARASGQEYWVCRKAGNTSRCPTWWTCWRWTCWPIHVKFLLCIMDMLGTYYTKFDHAKYYMRYMMAYIWRMVAGAMGPKRRLVRLNAR